MTYLPVQQNGIISLEELNKAITPETSLVSIMTVNNEIGVVQPVEEIGKLCRAKKVFFHTDAAQAAGKIPIDVQKMNIDLMSISGHKIYGPKGNILFYIKLTLIDMISNSSTVCRCRGPIREEAAPRACGSPAERRGPGAGHPEWHSPGAARDRPRGRLPHRPERHGVRPPLDRPPVQASH